MKEALHLEELVASTMDTDFYQISMSKLAREEFPGVQARYEFINRDSKMSFPPNFAIELRKYVDQMKTLRMTESQKAFLLKSHPYLGQEHMDWVFNYRFNPSTVHISQDGGKLSVWYEGPWEEEIFWETPLMALIVGLYNFMTPDREPKSGWHDTVRAEALKAKAANNLFGWMLSEFGSRRRYLLQHQREMLEIMVDVAGQGDKKALRGTSNPHLAHELGIEPIGTFAHQLVMFMAAKFGYKLANQKALEFWKKTFGGALPAALTDTYTHQVFFDDFDFTKDGQHDWVKVFRHDSGDEEEYRRIVKQNVIQHGRSLQEYSLLYTNGLTMDKAIEQGRRTVQDYGFNRGDAGIGTHLSHNVTGVKGLNIVIKPTHFFIPDETQEGGGTWKKVTKLSEEPGKTSGQAKEDAMTELGLKVVEKNGILVYERTRISQ